MFFIIQLTKHEKHVLSGFLYRFASGTGFCIDLGQEPVF